MLLGHRSIRVTERHYAPWVRSRQEQLEADVRQTWTVDVTALGKEQAKAERAKGENRGADEGTRRVHGRRVLVQ